MRKRLIWLTILSILLFGCGRIDTSAEISEILRTSVAAGEILMEEDTHGGFHGDGETYVVIQFYDEDDFKIPESGFWHQLPLSENIYSFLYDYEHHSQLREMISGEWIPQVENGAYFFFDRNDGSISQSNDEYLLTRGAFNFILAVYDAENQILYYYELDT